MSRDFLCVGCTARLGVRSPARGGTLVLTGPVARVERPGREFLVVCGACGRGKLFGGKRVVWEMV